MPLSKHLCLLNKKSNLWRVANNFILNTYAMQTSLKKIEKQNHFAGIGAINDNGQLYSSLYLVEQINIFRKEEGNRAVLRHDTLILKIEKEFEEEIREQKFLESSYAQKMPNGGEKESKMYELDFEQSLQILMSESKTVRKAVVQVLKKKQQPKELSRKELLTLALQAEEEKERILIENKNLSGALDSLLDWVSILKVSIHNNVNEKSFNWREIKKSSLSLGYDIKKIQSARYGYQNLYHINAFKAAYPKYNYEFNEMVPEFETV